MRALKEEAMTTDRVNTWDEAARFRVRGRGVFPIDMLRHDHCWPVDGDMQAIQEQRRDETEVTLVAQRRRHITPLRWASFGWIVVGIDGEDWW